MQTIQGGATTEDPNKNKLKPPGAPDPIGTGPAMNAPGWMDQIKPITAGPADPNAVRPIQMPTYMPQPGEHGYTSPEQNANDMAAKYPGGLGMPSTANLTMGAGQQPDTRTPTVDTPAQTAPTMPPGATDMGNNLVKLANGQVVPRDHPLFTAAMAAANPTPAATTPGSTPGPTTTPGATPGANTPPTTMNDAFKKTLMDKLNQPIAASINDPALKAQSEAFRLGQQRQGERAREAMAERRATQGGGDAATSSGGFDQDLTGLFQQQGEANAANDAGLVGREIQSQRDELARYMAMAGNTLDSEQKMALQEKIANMDAEIRKAALASQTQLGQGDLDLRNKLGSGGLNLGLLQALLGNQQFGQGLGAQVGMFNSKQDMDALLEMLRGLQ